MIGWGELANPNINIEAMSKRSLLLPCLKTILVGWLFCACGIGIAFGHDDSDNPRHLSVYDTAGRLYESIDENGHITRYGYDAAGRRTHDYAPDPITGQPGTTPVAITTHDAAGRRASVTDALGRITKYAYDPAGRLTDVIHPDDTPNDDSDNPRTKTEYDAAGRKTAEIDEQGRRTAFGYDAQGRLIDVRLAAGTAEQTSRSIAKAACRGSIVRGNPCKARLDTIPPLPVG